MIEWKECEHKFDDITSLEEHQARATLINCGLLKYFKLQKMRKEVLLLEYLIGLWDNDEQVFQIGPHMLEIEMDNVYFLMGLSRRGAPILFFKHWDTLRTTEAYVVEYCIPGSWLVGGRIIIKDVRDISLRSILFDITKLVGSTSAHLTSKSQISYAIQCL